MTASSRPRPTLVSLPKATPGTLVEVTTPEGFSVQVSIPMNVAPGDQFSVQYWADGSKCPAVQLYGTTTHTYNIYIIYSNILYIII